MLNDGVLMVVVPRGAGRAEHGRRRDGPDLGQRDGRLRQLGQHQRLVTGVAAAALHPGRAVTTYYNGEVYFVAHSSIILHYIHTLITHYLYTYY